MGKQVFIPLTDEILYEHPELIDGPVVPYMTGRPCHHWLHVELNPAEGPSRSRKANILKFPQWLAAFGLPALDKASRGKAPSLLSP